MAADALVRLGPSPATQQTTYKSRESLQNMSDEQPTQPGPESTAAAKRSNRRQLVLIALIAAVSVGGSYALYFSTVDSGVWGTTNQGQFVDPPRQVPELGLTDSTGVAHVNGEVWWVWLVQDGSCAAQCGEILTKMRNMHVLLNKDADRLRRAWVRTGGPEDAALTATFPKLHQLNQQPEDGVLLPTGIYIVDPLGNLVFRYSLQEMGKPVLQDLKRLLKVSQIG